MREILGFLGRLFLKIMLIASISFFLLYILPGDPARIVLGARATTQSLREFEKLHGLDRPAYEQYLLHIGSLFCLDLGNSTTRGATVVSIIAIPLQYTIELLIACVICFGFFSFIIPLAFIRYGMVRAARIYVTLTTSIAFVPVFVTASILVILSSKTGFLDLGSRPVSLIISALIISMYPISLGATMLNNSIAREMQTGYVMRASGFGIEWGSILKREILPNSLSSFLGVLANSIVYFVTGTILVEIIIGFPGIGRLSIEAIRTKDLPLLHGCTLVFSLVAVLVSEGLESCRKWIAPAGNSNTLNRW